MRAMGAAVTWIPVGEKGSLVMFGGTNDTETNVRLLRTAV
jgi:hypothetical protein